MAKSTHTTQRLAALVLDSMVDAVVAVDSTGKVVLANPAALRLLGRTSAQIEGRPLPSLIRARGPLPACLSGQKPAPGTACRHIVDWQCQGREVLRLRMVGSPLQDRSGATHGHAWTLHRAAAAEEALEVHERYSSLVDAATDLVALINRDQVHDAANAAYCAVHRLSRGEVLGRTLADVWGCQALEGSIRATLDRCLAGEAAELETQHTVPGEGRRLWEMTLRPLRDPAGRVSHVILAATDVTDRHHAREALHSSQGDYRGLFEQAHDAILISDAQTEAILEVNSRACELYGHTREQFLALDLGALSRGTEWELRKIRDAVCSGQTLQFETVHYRNDGSPLFLESNTSVVDYRDRRAVLSINRDVTERKAAEQALRASEERYALAALGAREGLWDWNLRDSTLFVSERWAAIVGQRASELDPDPSSWFDRIHPDDLERVRQDIANHMQGLTPHLESEYRMRHRDGSYRWVLSRGLAVRTPEGEVHRMAGSQADVTERRQREEQILHDAFHDGLTGLANRALFLDRLSRALDRTQRPQRYLFAALVLDLDRFKLVNEGLGHSVGDQLLTSLGRRLQASVRPGDTVARLGGDEFAILLDDLRDVEEAEQLTMQIQRRLEPAYNLAGRDVFASTSVGIALGCQEYHSPDHLLRDAETAMYRAKSSGTGRYQVFDKIMHTGVLNLLELETDLRHAVERERLRVHYQPIIGLRTGRIQGFEALLRWEREDRQLLLPSAFISLAEETGLIVPIGWYVLRQTCRQARRWLEQTDGADPLTVSVNLSARQFSQPDLVEQVRGIVAEERIPPERLQLEITESVLMEDAASRNELLAQLRTLNVRLSIDDFGTGYSSLSYLNRFPIDTLKIDRAFVSNLGESSENLEIVRTIIDLAHNLGLEVVAEGIETPAQLHHLRSLGCELGQGFFFSRALDSTQAGALLRARPRW